MDLTLNNVNKQLINVNKQLKIVIKQVTIVNKQLIIVNKLEISLKSKQKEENVIIRVSLSEKFHSNQTFLSDFQTL